MKNSSKSKTSNEVNVAAVVDSIDFTNEILALQSKIDNYARQGDKGGAVLPECKGQTTHNKKDAIAILNQLKKALDLFKNDLVNSKKVFEKFQEQINHKLSKEGEAERRAKWGNLPSFQKRKAEANEVKKVKILKKLGIGGVK